MSQVSSVVSPVLESPVELVVVSKVVVSSVVVSPVVVLVPSIVVASLVVSSVVSLSEPLVVLEVVVALLELPVAVPLPPDESLLAVEVVTPVVGPLVDETVEELLSEPPVSLVPVVSLEGPPQPASATPSTRPRTVGGATPARRTVPQNGHAEVSANTWREQVGQGSTAPGYVRTRGAGNLRARTFARDDARRRGALRAAPDSRSPHVSDRPASAAPAVNREAIDAPVNTPARGPCAARRLAAR